MLDQLFALKEQIERDLAVAADPEDNQAHLVALTAVEALIDYLL